MKSIIWYIRKIILILFDTIKIVLIIIFPRKLLRRLRKLFFNQKWNHSIAMPLDFIPEKYLNGFNIFGYFLARIGLSQGARSILSSVQESEINCSIINVKIGNTASHKEKISVGNNPRKVIYNINLFLVNIGQMDYLYQLYSKKTWDYRYNIGYWLWELTKLPHEWLSHLNFISEIWVPSMFIKNVFEKETTKPIYIIPYVIEPIIDKSVNCDFFGLPKNKFLYLIMFDSLSTIERKNPIDAIIAYMNAFQENEKTMLVIKINNALDKDVLKIKNITSTRNDIFIIAQNYNILITHTLINLCHVFISLHRSEGFGMVIAEAMYFGKIVIATNWSGNVDFMNSSNSFPIEFQLIEIQEDANMYKMGGIWAKPDINKASIVIKDVFDNINKYDYIGKNAMRDIRIKFSKNSVYNKINYRYKKILKIGEE